MSISPYAVARYRLASDIAGGLPALRRRFARFHRVGHLAHHAEHPLHAAYLGGVAFGGGYRYAAIGLLICLAIGWLCDSTE